MEAALRLLLDSSKSRLLLRIMAELFILLHVNEARVSERRVILVCGALRNQPKNGAEILSWKLQARPEELTQLKPG
jgi:hypothetical protein